MLYFSCSKSPPRVQIVRSADVPVELWRAIGRCIAESVVTSDSRNDVEISVDQFLASRVRLSSLISQYDCDATFDDDITLVLARADSERLEIECALRGEVAPISLDHIAHLLRESRFTRQLYDFQLRDFSRILSLSHGANFSVPGAGKTTVTYALYEAERMRGRVDRLLVVAPLSAFESWFDEAEESMYPTPVVARYDDGVPAGAEVVLINYQRLAGRYRDVADWVALHRCHVVLDEAHRMKRGRDGEWGNACLDLSHIAVRRDILTGTPAPQHPSDLVALLNFLWPHRATHILPASALLPTPPDSAMTALSSRLGPLFARTRKNELGLEPPALRVELVKMKEVQTEIYGALRNKISRSTRGSYAEQSKLRDLGEVIMYLLEAATNPSLLASAIGGEASTTRWPPNPMPAGTPLSEKILSYGEFETPRKFEKLAALVNVNANAGRKTLVWTNFIANITDISQRVLRQYNPAVVHGEVPYVAGAPPGSREHELSRFRHDDDCLVLVANPAAMGEGVSLHHECHDAIYVDRTFNAGQYLQSLDRIHRLGLPPGTETRVTFLVSAGTIDEVVDARIRVKAERLSALLSDPNLVEMTLPDEDSYGNWIEEGDLTALFSHLAE